MSRQAQFITPSPTLKDKMGPSAVFDADVVAKAEAALKSLSGNFQTWMCEEVDRLENARREAKLQGFSAESLEAVHQRAHDVKGLGSTYDYPLVTAMAASLCRLVETPQARDSAQRSPSVVEAHVDAIRAVVRGEIRDDAHPVGQTLLKELEARVRELVTE